MAQTIHPPVLAPSCGCITTSTAQAYWIYWSACFATVITWVFAVAAAADDAWLGNSSEWDLGAGCSGHIGSICEHYDAAAAFQFIATGLVSVALVVVVVAAFSSPPKTGLLGLVLGIMLIYVSVCQMIAFSLMAAMIAEFNNDSVIYTASAGPTLGVAVVAWLLGLAGAITILVLRSRATNDHEGPFRKCMSGGGGMAKAGSAEHNIVTV